jgi:hypothetical protein
VSCGVETKSGVLMCKACLDGMTDPLAITRRMQDPAADLRLHQVGSAILRIGPVPSSELDFGEGVEPAIRLRSLLDRGETGQLQTLVEEYLASVGVSLHVWGDERLPRRAFLWRLMEDVKGLEIKSEVWARASVRMGNVHALLVMAASELPVDEGWQAQFMREHEEFALGFYSRGRENRPLWKIAQSNQAMLYAWMGRKEEALAILEDLRPYRLDKDTVSFALKRAMVLRGAGKEKECREELSQVPVELLDSHLRRIKFGLEAKP